MTCLHLPASSDACHPRNEWPSRALCTPGPRRAPSCGQLTDIRTTAASGGNMRACCSGGSSRIPLPSRPVGLAWQGGAPTGPWLRRDSAKGWSARNRAVRCGRPVHPATRRLWRWTSCSRSTRTGGLTLPSPSTVRVHCSTKRAAGGSAVARGPALRRLRCRGGGPGPRREPSMGVSVDRSSCVSVRTVRPGHAPQVTGSALPARHAGTTEPVGHRSGPRLRGRQGAVAHE